MKITREEAVKSIITFLEQADSTIISQLLEKLLNEYGSEEERDDVVVITDEPRLLYEMDIPEIVEEIRSLIDLPNRPGFQERRLNELIARLDFKVEEQNPEADDAEIQRIVDSWIVGAQG